MSEERLDEALEALRNEEINSEELAKAKDRVWNKLSNPHATLCSEFQSQLNDYLNGQMASGKKLLLEDHLGRCPACRSKLAEKKGESNTIPFPGRRKSWAPAKYAKWAIAAALALMVLYATRDRIFEFASPNSGRATVASLEG